MKYIKNSYSSHSKLYNTIFIIISVGITLGLIISLSLNKDILSNIYDYFINYIKNYNNYRLSSIIYPIVIYLSIFILSLTIIGSFMPFLALFIENMSIGLIVGVLIKIKALKGLLFSLIYFIFTKLFYLIILIYLIINIYKFINILIKSLKHKTNQSIYSLYSKTIFKLIACIIAISAYNLLFMFITPSILKLITPLLLK